MIPDDAHSDLELIDHAIRYIKAERSTPPAQGAMFVRPFTDPLTVAAFVRLMTSWADALRADEIHETTRRLAVGLARRVLGTSPDPPPPTDARGGEPLIG